MARILLIDDDPQVLKLFDKLLTKGGHSVVSTNSGESALEIMNTVPGHGRADALHTGTGSEPPRAGR
jgi:CheY-like chemotaxis protein